MDGDTTLTAHKPITAEEARDREQKELKMERDNKQLGTDNDEKVTVNVNRNSFDEDGKSDADVSDEGAITDLFVSLPPLKGVPPEENPLTVRAVLVGIILGSLCNASNVYLGPFLSFNINTGSKTVLTSVANRA
jgi:hypothetical protein